MLILLPTLCIEGGRIGSLVGRRGFEKKAINERIDKVEEIAEKLSNMMDAQSEYVLLRSCLAIPKIMFTLRTTDPGSITEI